MKKHLSVLIVLLGFGLVGCSDEPSWEDASSVSWSKADAFTECDKNLAGVPKCAISFNKPESGLHTHIIETDISSIDRGDTLIISLYKGVDKNIQTSRKSYTIMDIVKSKDSCRLIINPQKYYDVYLTVSGCKEQ